MSRLQCIAIVGLVAFFALGSSSKSTKESTSIVWSPSWELSYKKAKEENRPILVAINAEGIALQGDTGNANEEMSSKTYRDPKLVAASAQSVNLIASAATHRRVAVKQTDGSFRQECTKFSGVTCAEHQEVERILRLEHFKNVDDIVSPQHLLLQPNGALIARREYQVGAKELAKMIEDAVKVVGKPKKAQSPTATHKPSQSAKKN